MCFNTSISAPPPAPAPVDPGKAALDYINAMADPALQQKLLQSEAQFRPEYVRLNLAEQEQYLRGIPGKEGQPGQAGAIDILQQVTPGLVKAQEMADAAQRDADIRALQSQSGGYLSALMKANPQMFAQLEAARAMGGERDSYKDLQTALSNTRIFGDVNITPAQAALIGAAPTMQAQGYAAALGQASLLGEAPTAQASLLGSAPTVSAQGYDAATMQAALLGAAPTIEAQGYNAQGYAAQGYDAARAQRVADVAAQTIGQGALGQQLYGQAMEAAPTAASDTFRRRAAEMAVSTGQLSPEELRNAQQAAREAFASRGLEMSNQAIAAEAMSRAEAVRQRQAQDIQQAAALNQAYLADLNASRGFATGVYGQDLGRAQMNQDAQLRSALANQAAGMQLSLADQQALNQASQFGAMSANEAAQFGAAAQNQANQFAAAAQNAASQGNAQLASQYQMANQQAQMQANAANQAATNQAGQFGASAQNTAAMANAEQQARFAMANQAAQNQFGMANVERQAQFALANQAAQNQFGLANLDAANQAAQFGAQAGNVAGQANLDAAMRTALANQATQTQVGLTNQEMMANLAQANRDFQASQQQQGIANLGVLGQARQGELAANRAFQQNLVGMYGAAFDPMTTVLGRPSGALGVGQQQQGLATGMMQGLGGPQLFNPDAGVNLALQNAANLGNYQAATYGARAGAQGARAAGIYQGVGNALSGCWVARQVYGNHNPKWLAFREWLYTKAPNWFVELYEMYGERFAEWISDKPRIKNLIRKWMDSRIKSL
jgi:hypothetical protein